MINSNKVVLAYFGHHKCASKMIMNIIKGTCRYMGLNYASFHSPKMWGYVESGMSLDKIVNDLDLDFVSYNNADKIYIGETEKFLGIHVFRDPRDIVVSAYFSHRYSHSLEHWPELAIFRKTLESLSQNAGFLESMKFTAKLKIDGWNVNLFDALMNWDYSLPNVMEIKFEELINNPYQIFLDMFDFLGILDHKESFNFDFLNSFFRYRVINHIPGMFSLRKKHQIPYWLLLSFVYSNRFLKLTEGRDKGEEDVKSHYRKGIPGDWRNYFCEEHKNFFKENYNDLLIKLGYEQDDRW